MFVLSKKLIKVKSLLNSYVWDTKSLASQLSSLKNDQILTIQKLKNDPRNSLLLQNLVGINTRYKDVTA